MLNPPFVLLSIIQQEPFAQVSSITRNNPLVSLQFEIISKILYDLRHLA